MKAIPTQHHPVNPCLGPHGKRLLLTSQHLHRCTATPPESQLPSTFGSGIRTLAVQTLLRLDLPQTQPAGTLATHHSRRLRFLASTLDTITEHARALEEAAMERHRIRMARSQDTLRDTIQDAVEHFRRESSAMQTTQQLDLKHFKEQQAQHWADTRDQHAALLADTITSQMDELRLQFSQRLYNCQLVEPSASSTTVPDAPTPARSTSFTTAVPIVPPVLSKSWRLSIPLCSIINHRHPPIMKSICSPRRMSHTPLWINLETPQLVCCTGGALVSSPFSSGARLGWYRTTPN